MSMQYFFSLLQMQARTSSCPERLDIKSPLTTQEMTVVVIEMLPNPTFNTDVPSAALRVSLRYAG